MLKSNLGQMPVEYGRDYHRSCRFLRNSKNKAHPGASAKQLQQQDNAKRGKNEKSGLKIMRKRASPEASTQTLPIYRSHGIAAEIKDPIEGFTRHVIAGSTFTLNNRYEGLKTIGKGSYGVVCCAQDTLTKKKVAIKKIQDMSKHAVNAKHVLREMRLMRHLGSHPNISTLQNLYLQQDADELYLVMDLMDSDLHKIIQSPQPLSDAHFRYFMFQLLKGVRFLHENRIIHRDLKPGNLLVTKSCNLKITDFGLARVRPIGRGSHPDDTVHDPMTEHVVTRWYRPPELMLCPNGLYEYSVDLWSCGCILAEMFGRAPLFPGRNFVDQLTLIFDTVGAPTPHEVSHIRNPSALKFLESMKGKQRESFLRRFAQASPLAVDLLEGLLVFDPPDRLTVHESISHPYFEPLWASDIYTDPPYTQRLNFDFENQPLTVEGLRHLIVDEVKSFRAEASKIEQELRVSTAVPEKEMATTATTPTATAAAAAAAAAKSEQRSNGIRRTKNNAPPHSFGEDDERRVHTSSQVYHQVMEQKDAQSIDSSVGSQKSDNKSVSPPKQHSLCDDSQGEDHASSSTCHGTQPSENSSSLSSTIVSHRPTSRGYVERDGGGVATAASNYSKNVNDLLNRMHRLDMKHEKKNPGANEAAGTARCPHKGNNKSVLTNCSYSSDAVVCCGDDTIRRSPTSTLHKELNKVIAAAVEASPLSERSKKVDTGSQAAMDHHIPSSYTSVGKPPTKQRRT